MSAWFASACKSKRLVAAIVPAALIWLICAFAAPGSGLGPALAQAQAKAQDKAQTEARTEKSTAPAPTCATCHVGVASSYAHAPMRHALESAGADPVLDTHARLAVQQDGYSYTVETKDGKSTYTVSDGKDSLTVPIHWMFGQQSQTWVLEKDGNFYEGLVSYFPRENGLATTPGDGKTALHNLTEAMGRKLSTWEVLQCFNCHATHASEGAKLTLDKLTPGLGCERCHIGVEQHNIDAAHDNFTTLPRLLKTMDAQDAANFCGQCHRTWDTVLRNGWKGTVDVRFQPYRLQNSRCFVGNDARISCLACHNPHQPVNHNLAFYDAKCLACHGEAKVSKVAASAAAPTIKHCPVAKANCVSCHMPKVELPGGHALFTDHMIRIVKAGEPYPD